MNYLKYTNLLRIAITFLIAKFVFGGTQKLSDLLIPNFHGVFKLILRKVHNDNQGKQTNKLREIPNNCPFTHRKANSYLPSSAHPNKKLTPPTPIF